MAERRQKLGDISGFAHDALDIEIEATHRDAGLRFLLAIEVAIAILQEEEIDRAVCLDQDLSVVVVANQDIDRTGFALLGYRQGLRLLRTDATAQDEWIQAVRRRNALKVVDDADIEPLRRQRSHAVH